MNEKAESVFPAVPAPCVCNRVGIVYRLINQFYARAFGGIGITNEQVSLLILLLKRGPFSQRDVAQALGMEKSTISRNVKNLEAKGWAKVERAPGKKEIRLSLTARGRKMVEKILPLWKERQEQAEKLFGQTTLAELNRMIVALKEHLK